MTKVLHLFLDAFSSRYLEYYNPPFFDELKQKGFFSAIEPTFGFQNIGAAIYTGFTPYSTKLFCDYVLQPNQRTSQLFKKALAAVSYIPNDRLVKGVNLVANVVTNRHMCEPILVPPELIDCFGPKLRRPLYSPNAIEGVPTLFDYLDAYGVSYWQTNIRDSVPDTRVYSRTRAALETEKYRVICAKFSGLDRVGHTYGPISKEVRDYVMRLDKWVANIAEVADKQGDWSLILFSDHGMSPIEKTVDVEAMLFETGLAIRDDIIVFLDSTIARFWFRSPRARSIVEDIFAESATGRLLTTNERRLLGIDCLGDEFGELFFAVNDKHVISPSYYHRHECLKGMHGYAYSTYDYPVLFLLTKQKVRKLKGKLPRHIDILPTTLSLVKANGTQATDGRSLVVE